MTYSLDDTFNTGSPYYNGAPLLTPPPSAQNAFTDRVDPSVIDSGSGVAVYKNIAVGGNTLQYQVGNAGIFSFGDGSDGAATFVDQGTAPTGTTKTDNTAGATIFRFDRDVYYTTLTLNATVTINSNGYRIFCSTSATVNGTITQKGAAGTNGSTGATAGAGGAGGAKGSGGGSLPAGYFLLILNSGDGEVGGSTVSPNGSNGVNGSPVTNSLTTSNGPAGGHGGDTTDGTGGTGGAASTTAVSNVKLIANWHLATLLDVGATGATLKFTSSASSAGAGGGAGKISDGGGGGGGGGGSPGGMIALYAKSITVGASGVITTNGGNGGNGGNGATANAGVGGGGSAGNGGVTLVVYNALTNNGTISASGGTKGTKGTVGTTTNATDGSNGSAGVVYQFQLSI